MGGVVLNLRFIIGRAGSGKTHNCLTEIRQALLDSPAGPSIIFLVPEQATFQMEYALTTTPGLGGLIRAQVLSFRRLAFHILAETGGAARVPIGELGKRMVLRRLLESNREQLNIFNHSAEFPGFADKIASAIGEMKIYGIRPNELISAATIVSSEQKLLHDKLSDLALLYQDLEQYMAGRYTDPDDYLDILANNIEASSTIKKTEIWVDGFTGFTPQELAVIKSLLKNSLGLSVTLCIDPDQLNKTLTEEDLFYPPWVTYQEIKHIVEQTGAQLEKPLLLNSNGLPRFIASPAITHLENNYFQYPLNPCLETISEIQIAAGANRRAEVAACAREIINLCQDKNYRWRDIAVLLRDIESYHELIATIFNDYQIPFFIDHKRSIMHHPLVELIRSAIDVIATGWSYEPVFRYLKTDLIPTTREEVDILENYVLAHGIRGHRWTDESDWNYRRQYTLGEDKDLNEAEIDRMNQLNCYRRQATSALAEFEQMIKQSANVHSYSVALFHLIEKLEIASKLTAWSIEEEQAGRLEMAREHLQIWNLVINLLDEIVASLGDEQISLETYLAILDAGFESMQLGLIPPGLDQVVIGSLDRSKNPNLKAVLLLGASEGVFPAHITEDGVFNDTERERLDQLGLTLAPGSRRRAFDEQFLIYTAITRAGNYLWISYPLADDEGKTITPSPVIKRIKELFPQIKESVFQSEPTWKHKDDWTFISRPEQTLNYLAGSLREAKAGHQISPLWIDVYNWFLQNNRKIFQAIPILDGVFHFNQEDSVNPEITHKLYGQPLSASVSRIELYKSCPFAHFSAYGLRLKERPLYKLAAPDMGEFFHAALKDFVEQLKTNELDWDHLNNEQCLSISNNVVEKLTPQLLNEILLSTARYRYLAEKLKRIINRATLILSEHARRSLFKPLGVEISFGPGGQIPPVTINLPGNTLQLSGRIDRIDFAQKDGQNYLQIIDYKSSANTITLPDVYYGLKLQLITYLHVALTHADKFNCPNALPGGIMYFMVKEPLIKSAWPLEPTLIEQNLLKILKMKGYLLANPAVIRMMDNKLDTGWSDLFSVGINKNDSFYSKSNVITTEQFATLRNYLEKIFHESGQEIINGHVEINPYRKKEITACKYCSFTALCQFDTLLEENKYHHLPAINNDQFWNLLSDRRDSDESSQMD